MKRFFLHIVVPSLSLWPAGSLLAQVKATVDKQQILIGEPIHLMLEATVTGDSPLTWPTLDSIPHFEFVEKHAVDSTVSQGLRSYRQYLTVTSFDSGVWSIPRLPFGTGKRTLLTDSIPIRIGYTKIDPSKDYHDIKDIIDIPNPFARWFGWIVATFALASVAFVIWLLQKKKILQVLVPRPPAPRLSPYEEAIQQLDQLASQGVVEDGAVKTFYSRLGEILRLYLYRRAGIASFSETSEELIGQIRRLSLPQEQFTDLAEALRMGDFVKFAKYKPGPAESEAHYRVIRGAIGELNRKLEENDRAQAAITGQSPSPASRPPANRQTNI
ncbi:MAG TPA: hypothetical protein VMH27_18730 [Puia sp.]|nr:hypothetical protein [Puia sp.]